jgi:site-specific DNA-cytosine methylase
VTVRQALAHLPIDEMGRPVRLRWKSNVHPPSRLDEPSMAIPASQPGNGGMTVVSSKHPPIDPDAPATTVRGGGEGHAAPAMVVGRQKRNHRPSAADEPAKTLTRNPNSDGALLLHERHPISRPDEPSFVIKTNGGRYSQAASAVEWPWDRPSTTIVRHERQSPPGRNGRAGESQATGPNAIVLSEKAAALLQGFPDGWSFAGVTKRARWSQIGQAMPPPLAEAVGRQIAKWFRARAGAAA